MKVLVIGSGGREHVLVWKLVQSKKVTRVYCMPGNAGIGRVAENVSGKIDDFESIKQFVKKEKIEYTIVGPEAPLVEGIVDSFRKDGLAIFGPDAKASRLEGDKAFAKSFMKKYRIPTAQYQVCRSLPDAERIIREMGAPVVVKASGLAAGKGVIICQTAEEARHAAKQMLEDKKFGSAGDEIVIEEMLAGEEVSIIAFCDGKALFNLLPSQDHKRVFDNDEGPNTGGMGAYAPAPVVTREVMKKIEEEIFNRFLDGVNKEGFDFRGVIYFGLMITSQGPKVLEFNVRFGDPETQVILPLLDADLLEIIEAANNKRLAQWKEEHRECVSNRSAVCIVLASGGYPGSYAQGKKICGLEEQDPLVFHAGTVMKDGSFVTSGGRVLGITAVSSNLKEAIDEAYKKVLKIYFDGMHYRKDIGHKALKIVVSEQ